MTTPTDQTSKTLPAEQNSGPTPGPWFWNRYRSQIGTQDPTEPPYNNRECVALLYEGRGFKTTEANARLIAAAPELLEALREIIRQRKGREPKWEAQARAAIAKAKGQP